MTKDDIIRMAREAGLAYGTDERVLTSVLRFTNLVAAAAKAEERERTEDEALLYNAWSALKHASEYLPLIPARLISPVIDDLEERLK